MYLTDMVNHVKQVKKAISELGGEAHLDVMNFVLDVKVGTRTRQLFPQFTQIFDGRRRYTTEFNDQVMMFNGWYPAVNKWWEISSEKLKFKALLTQAGFRTPAYTSDPGARPEDVIIKQSSSSFGDGLRGPFRTVTEDDPDSILGESEYYEQFVFGWIAKIWYWNEAPVCLKLQKMPALKADGTSTLRELLDRERALCEKYFEEGWFDAMDWAFLDRLIAYQHVGPDDILPAGREVFLDYRYNNYWIRWSWAYDNVLPTSDVPGLREQLEEAGRFLWRQIPEDRRQQTVYTVDAILDARDCFWFLEMNSNPQVHPDVYVPMMRDLFGQDEAACDINSAERMTAQEPLVP